MRRVVIHQPDFVPYLGFFERLTKADIFIVLDHVQFSRRGWTHRDCIKTRTGKDWLTISVQKSDRDVRIRDVQLVPDMEWRNANLNKIRENYRSAPFFEQIFEPIERIYSMPLLTLFEMNSTFLTQCFDWLDIEIESVASSQLNPSGVKSELIAGLVQSVGGTHYVSGMGAEAYHDQAPFDDRGIAVMWQQFKPRPYPQQFGGDFVPMLSVLDALFNCGTEGTRELIK